jgi:uncharacterized protein YjbI with pentapeptide repeats
LSIQRNHSSSLCAASFDLGSADLRNPKLGGAHLTDANLRPIEKSLLFAVRLSSADLRNAKLGGVHLPTTISDPDLSYAWTHKFRDRYARTRVRARHGVLLTPAVSEEDVTRSPTRKLTRR